MKVYYAQSIICSLALWTEHPLPGCRSLDTHTLTFTLVNRDIMAEPDVFLDGTEVSRTDEVTKVRIPFLRFDRAPSLV